MALPAVNPSLAGMPGNLQYNSATASTVVVNATFGAIWSALVTHIAAVDVGTATAGSYHPDNNRLYQLLSELDALMFQYGAAL